MNSSCRIKYWTMRSMQPSGVTKVFCHCCIQEIIVGMNNMYDRSPNCMNWMSMNSKLMPTNFINFLEFFLFTRFDTINMMRTNFINFLESFLFTLFDTVYALFEIVPLWKWVLQIPNYPDSFGICQDFRDHSGTWVYFCNFIEFFYVKNIQFTSISYWSYNDDNCFIFTDCRFLVP